VYIVAVFCAYMCVCVFMDFCHMTYDKQKFSENNELSPICGNEEWPALPGALEPPVAAVAEPCVAPVLALCRPSVRPPLLDGSTAGTANPLASASAPSIGRKLNSSGLSWLALKPDSAAADDDVGAASRVSGDGAGGGGDARSSRGDWDGAGCGLAAVACSTGFVL